MRPRISMAGKEKLVFNDSYASRIIISVSAASSLPGIFSKYHPPGYLQIFYAKFSLFVMLRPEHNLPGSLKEAVSLIALLWVEIENTM